MGIPQDIRFKNRRVLIGLVAITLGMFGFGFALVPLYGLLCELTGAPSVGQRITVGAQPGVAPSASATDRWVTVKFDGTVHPELPWDFHPLVGVLQVRVGELNEVRFAAENRSSSRVTGQAIPSVVPWQATGFFTKLECFCFRQQTLEGGQGVEMPLKFMISPDLPQSIDSLTLSYSFMRTSPAPVGGDKLVAK
jgi:cytochrome c oxidase assembly protein subunit 11